MPFSIVPLDSGVIRIALEGELDVFTIEALRPELIGVVRRCPTMVEVDFSRLRAVSTRGMQVLVEFFGSLARIDCRITLTEIGDQPFRCLRTALLDAIFNVWPAVN